MNIGIVIGRIGGIDGVALETEKWITVLERMGHDVFILSGEFDRDVIEPSRQTLLPVLSFFSSECDREQNEAFFRPKEKLGNLLARIEDTAEYISQNILGWLQVNEIEMLCSQNASALPSHLSMGLGIKGAVEKTEIPTVCHDHDFAWERGERYVSPHNEINQLVENTFPLRLPSVSHAVINTAAKETLKKRYNREATFVPNVMDFDTPFGVPPQQTEQLRTDLDLHKNDIPLLQPTRIVARKGIETVAELLHRLDDKRVKLMISGTAIDDDNLRYTRKLVDLVHEYKLEDQIVSAFKWLEHIRVRDLEQIEDPVIREARWVQKALYRDPENDTYYSLSDIYSQARVCTYFSTYEGFGNAFLESVISKTPIFVNNYKPVYWPDIGSKGFRAVMLEDNELTDQAVKEMAEIIYDPELCREIGEYNFELGKKHFSYDVLEKLLGVLFRR